MVSNVYQAIVMSWIILESYNLQIPHQAFGNPGAVYQKEFPDNFPKIHDLDEFFETFNQRYFL